MQKTNIIYISTGLILFLFQQPICFAQTATKVISLNNDGVAELNKRNWKKAVRKLDLALKIKPNYFPARQNLAIAYSNMALAKQSKPLQSVKFFHMSIYLNPANDTTVANFDGVIRAMNRNPECYKDRIELGDVALENKDYIGAFVEYKTAQCIDDNDELTKKLHGVIKSIQTSHKYNALEKSLLEDWTAVYTKEYGRKD